MRIIISPAKQMRIDTDLFTCTELPVFMEKTEILMRWMQGLSFEEQKKLWACSDKIARQNSERFANMDLRENLTPALLAYDGIQYTYMAPAVFEDGQYDYVQEHLRILSGFYGVVKPMDGVVPYRLEMQAKAAVSGHKNLYDFWGDSLYREVLDSSRIIINLASKSNRRTGILRVFSANRRRERSSRKASMPRWHVERWCGTWQQMPLLNRKRSKRLIGADTGSGRTCRQIKSMFL